MTDTLFHTARSAVAGGWRAVRWYLKTASGESRYEIYAAHHRAKHPGNDVPTEREFWRKYYADQDANPGQRCC